MDVVTETEVIEAIDKVDRFVNGEKGQLTDHVSALAEIWGLMIYERAVEMPVSRLTARQLSAWQASRQESLAL